MQWDAMVTVGRIIRPHGHRGGVVVQPESDFAAERFAPGQMMRWRRGEVVSDAQVATSREFRGRWVVTFEGVTSMDEAETLRGVELRVPADALRPLPPDAHYVHDLEGCEVVTMSGDVVGRVARVDRETGTAVLVVAGTEGEVLVPLATSICREIDVGARRIAIDPPAGLLELNRSPTR